MDTDSTPPVSGWILPEPVPVGPAPGYAFAGFWRRFWAFLIDEIILVIPSWIVFVPIVLNTLTRAQLDILSGQNLYDVDPVSGLVTLDPAAYAVYKTTIDQVLPLFLAAVAGFLLLQLVYCAIFWSTRGGTPGQLLLGVQIRNERDGRRIGFARSCLRCLGYVVSIWIVYLGFIWVAFDKRKQGWHDKIAGTVAVRRLPGYVFPADAHSAPRPVVPLAERTVESNIPERMGDVWRAYKSNGRRILGIALVVQGVLGLLIYPATIGSLDRLFGAWSQISAGGQDPAATEQSLGALLPLQDHLALFLIALAGGLGVLVILLLIGLYAGLLANRRVQDRTVRGAVRGLGAAIFVITIPVLVVGLAQGLVIAAEASWLQDPTDAALGGTIAISDGVLIAIGIVTIYAIARWSIAIPALLVERLDWRSAMARSVELTRGRRVSVLLTLFVLGLANSLVLAISVYVPALLLGPASSSGIDIRFLIELALVLIGSVLVAPLVPLAAVVMYQEFSVIGPKQAKRP